MAENLRQNLLCTETIIDHASGGDEDKALIFGREPSNSEMGFPTESEGMIRKMMEREGELSPRDDYLQRLRTGNLDFNVRRKALDWIGKACGHHKFGPLSLCLSINYLDRFLSVHNLPSGKAWTMQLLAVACLSLAAKLEETKVPHLIDLQVGDPGFVFEPKSVQRMELLVLSKLNWRLRAITPCSYIRCFLRKIKRCDQDLSRRELMWRSLQVICSRTKGIDFLEFKPSEIAAAATLFVSGHLHFHTSFSSFLPLLHKERVERIMEMIANDGSISYTQTPNGVLDVSASYFSFKTDVDDDGDDDDDDDFALHCTVSPSQPYMRHHSFHP